MGKPLPQCLRIVGFEVERFLVGAARFAGMTKVARYVAVMLPNGGVHRAFKAHGLPDLGERLFRPAGTEQGPGKGIDDIRLIR